MKIDFKYYISVFLRRSPYFIIIVAIFASLGLTIALIIPPEYEARATLLVEAEQIPENLASSTVRTQTAEQIQIIQQRLLSRQNLLDLANRLNLYPTPDDGVAITASEIVRDMRDRTEIERRGSGAATVLSISFRGRSSRQTAEVANEFVTLVLQENVQIRTAQAGDTLAFFNQEVERLGAELDAQSVRLIEFQNSVGVAIPSNLSFLRSSLESMLDRRAENRRDILALEDQKTRLSEMFRVTGGPDAGLSPAEQRLRIARQELDEAQVVFSPQNPRLAILQSRVALLEDQVETEQQNALAEAEAMDEGDEAPDELPTTEREVVFQFELDERDRQIAILREEIDSITQSIAVVEDQIAAAPSNGVALGKLQRDFDNLQGQYNQAVARLSVAATGERIELLAKGQRMSVIEQATPPESPTKPNRPMIAGAGVGLGIGAGLMLIVLMELLNRSIRRPVELTNRLGITPLGVLPYIRTKREINFRRFAIMGLAAVLILFVPLGLFAIHSFVFPLDSIIERIFNRLGFSVIG